MRIPTLAIVGVGLMGGSIALAARRRGIATRILGVDQQTNALKQARQQGILDDVSTHLQDVATAADVILFCTPVDSIAAGVLEAAAHCRPGTLLSDVGSTKAAILRDVQGRLPKGIEFIGSHPLSGSEKHGLAHANAQLLEGRLVLVTPGQDTSDDALSRIRDLWLALGAQVRVMEAEEHDRAVALTSHLPHLLSSALAGILPPELRDLTATGFRDSTRLAAGHPDLWSAIFRANAANLLAALDRFEEQIQQFRQALLAEDAAALDRLLRQGKKIREELA
jgi:cyclohexadieny/prephenate dehydrogenase